MMTCRKSKRYFLFILACGFLISCILGDVSGNSERDKSEPNITVAARVVKDVYEPNEPVPLVVAIANHSSEPVYLFTDRPDIFGTSAGVIDANGVRVMGDPVSTPPVMSSSSDSYMKKDGKRIYVVPVSKIEGPAVILALTPDALRLHHGHLAEGVYYLRPGAVEIIHKVSDLIIREDVPHRLWIDPRSPITKQLYKGNTVKIEIRKKTEAEKPVVQARPFAWSTFLTGTITGIVVLCLILLLKKKLVSRSK
jgi:hypothetical protein